LVEHLGGRSTPAIGWALGLERLVELYKVCGTGAGAPGLDAYLVAVGDAAENQALVLAEALRDEAPDLNIEVNLGGGSFKSQFKRADKSGAKVALILGDEELASKRVGIKPLRQEADQQTVPWEQAVKTINSISGDA
jgi:histidyl-tRNA synthetase